MNRIFSVCLLSFLLSSAVQAQSRLQPGSKAPNLSFTDVQDKRYNLKQLGKDHKVLLVFMRHAWCPICNVRTHQLKERYQELKDKGYEVVVFYQSPKDKMLEYVQDYKLPFIVVSDTELKFYKTYQLEYNEKKLINDIQQNAETQSMYKQGIELIGGEAGMSKYIAGDKEPGMDLIPGDFVVDKTGKLQYAYYGKFFGDHLALDLLK